MHVITCTKAEIKSYALKIDQLPKLPRFNALAWDMKYNLVLHAHNYSSVTFLIQFVHSMSDVYYY